MNSPNPYENLDEWNEPTEKNFVSEEVNADSYITKKSLLFFNSFEESDNYFRQKMAKMSPEERLIQLKKIRINSKRFLPATSISKSFALTLTIEKGENR